MGSRGKWTAGSILGVAVALVVAAALIGGAFMGINSVYKNYHRGQLRADANNRVRVTAINIRNAQQEALVVRAQNNRVFQQGQQRIITAKAVAESQRIIHSTLTPLYVQLEAIEAQKAIAISGKNNTVIYVPAGTNGTPVITQAAAGDKAYAPVTP